MNFLLSFYCHFLFFLVHFTIKKNKKKGSRIVSLLSCACPVLAAGVHFGLNFDQMEHLEGEQHCQYPMERKPNAYRSIRDYINPPWVSAPSYMVPPRNAPYGNAYNPSWGNHLNHSWGQYAPPASS